MQMFTNFFYFVSFYNFCYSTNDRSEETAINTPENHVINKNSLAKNDHSNIDNTMDDVNFKNSDIEENINEKGYLKIQENESNLGHNSTDDNVGFKNNTTIYFSNEKSTINNGDIINESKISNSLQNLTFTNEKSENNTNDSLVKNKKQEMNSTPLSNNHKTNEILKYEDYINLTILNFLLTKLKESYAAEDENLECFLSIFPDTKEIPKPFQKDIYLLDTSVNDFLCKLNRYKLVDEEHDINKSIKKHYLELERILKENKEIKKYDDFEISDINIQSIFSLYVYMRVIDYELKIGPDDDILNTILNNPKIIYDKNEIIKIINIKNFSSDILMFFLNMVVLSLEGRGEYIGLNGEKGNILMYSAEIVILEYEKIINTLFFVYIERVRTFYKNLLRLRYD